MTGPRGFVAPLACAILLGLHLACGADDPPEPTYPLEQEIRFGFTVRNTGGELLRDAELRVFAPVKQLANQKTLQVEASHAFTLLEDDLGNQVLRFLLTIPPWGSEIVSVKAKVAFADHLNREALELPERYLGPAPFVESEDPRIEALAAELAGREDLEVARAAYLWLAGHLRDPGYVSEDQGAVHALEHREGDCTEHMYLFTALARARGVPARTVAGFVIDERATVHADDYHNWAEFYADDAWQVADSQRGQFGHSSRPYLAMRVIDPREANPLGSSQRFLAFHPDLEVRMN